MRYSDDLRRHLIEAWQRGLDTQAELADLFGVSVGWVEKVLRRWRDTGETTAASFQPGRRSRLKPARVQRLIAQHSDATLAELARRLRVHASTVCRWLQQMGLPRKKRRCTPANATRLACKGCVRVGGRRAVIWMRAG
jgi:transposase